MKEKIKKQKIYKKQEYKLYLLVVNIELTKRYTKRLIEKNSRKKKLNVKKT